MIRELDAKAAGEPSLRRFPASSHSYSVAMPIASVCTHHVPCSVVVRRLPRREGGRCDRVRARETLRGAVEEPLRVLFGLSWNAPFERQFDAGTLRPIDRRNRAAPLHLVVRRSVGAARPERRIDARTIAVARACK